MQSFKSYRHTVTEGTLPQSLDDIKAAFSVVDLPARRREVGLAGVSALERGLHDGEIYNAKYNEAKSAIMYALEGAYSKARDEELYSKAHKLPLDKRGEFFDKYDVDAMFNIGSAKKLSAFYAIRAVEMPKCNTAVKGLLQFKDTLDRLKPVVIKGRKPKPVDPNDNSFKKPVITYDTAKQVSKFLQDAAADVRAQLFKATVDSTTREVEMIKKAGITDSKSRQAFLKAKPHLQILSQSVLKTVRDPRAIRGGLHYEIEDDATLNALISREATRLTDDILGQFVAKNTSKLALIVSKKAGIKDHKILTNRVRNNVLENEMFFEFTDGSSFKIYSKVEYAYSPNGKFFMRMPTRFTDVTLADGTKMKGAASEERMITEF